MPLTRTALFAAAAIGCAVAPPASAQSWQTYDNARFGYTVCYPANALTPQPEAENGDGRTFTGANGVKMRVWGRQNANDISLADQMARAAMPATDPNPRAYPRINYRKLYDDFYIATGNTRDEDSFEKTYLKDGQFITLQIVFPQSEAAKWRPLVRRISGCFKPAE